MCRIYCRNDKEHDYLTYLLLKDKIDLLNEEVIGHVVMDKIKLKSSAAFNCNNNEVTGCVVEQLNKRMMFENILLLTKKKKETHSTESIC